MAHTFDTTASLQTSGIYQKVVCCGCILYLSVWWLSLAHCLVFECTVLVCIYVFNHSCLLLKEMGTWASCSNEFCEDMTQVG